jgi:hypothetical protein
MNPNFAKTLSLKYKHPFVENGNDLLLKMATFVFADLVVNNFLEYLLRRPSWTIIFKDKY